MASSSITYLENKIKEKAMENIEFRKNLLLNPKETIKKHLNINIPEDLEIKIVEDSAKTVYLVLPPENGEDAVASW